VPDAFQTFPNPEVEQELIDLALRTIRVAVQAHGKWLIKMTLMIWKLGVGTLESGIAQVLLGITLVALRLRLRSV
jgi:hypothetical protein